MRRGTYSLELAPQGACPPAPVSPSLGLGLNGTVFAAGATMAVTGILSAGNIPGLVDAYIVLQLPSGEFLSLQLGGRFAPGVIPIARGFAPFDFQAILAQVHLRRCRATRHLHVVYGADNAGNAELREPAPATGVRCALAGRGGIRCRWKRGQSRFPPAKRTGNMGTVPLFPPEGHGVQPAHFHRGLLYGALSQVSLRDFRVR